MKFCDVLTLIFIVLKLVGVVDWSWWAVLSPQWIAILIYVVFKFLVFLIEEINKK